MTGMVLRKRAWLIAVLSVIASALVMCGCPNGQLPIDTLVINETSRMIQIQSGIYEFVKIAPGSQYLYEHSANNNRYGGVFAIYAEDGSLLAVIEKSGTEIDEHLVYGHLYILRVSESDLLPTQEGLVPGSKIGIRLGQRYEDKSDGR